MDELFEALTLIQTGKVRHFPIVLVGRDYWSGLLDWIRDTLVAKGAVDATDMDLLLLTDDPDEAVSLIQTHSVVGSSKDGIASDRGAPET
jgi:predicted Rossmann-fold nucleotide-binding protein